MPGALGHAVEGPLNILWSHNAQVRTNFHGINPAVWGYLLQQRACLSCLTHQASTLAEGPGSRAHMLSG